MEPKPVKYIIPPRLRNRSTFFGYYPEELLVLVPLLFAGFVRKLYHSQNLLLIAAAIIAVLLFRGLGSRNALSSLRLMYRLCFTPQIFTLKECEKKSANK